MHKKYTYESVLVPLFWEEEAHNICSDNVFLRLFHSADVFRIEHKSYNENDFKQKMIEGKRQLLPTCTRARMLQVTFDV